MDDWCSKVNFMDLFRHNECGDLYTQTYSHSRGYLNANTNVESWCVSIHVVAITIYIWCIWTPYRQTMHQRTNAYAEYIEIENDLWFERLSGMKLVSICAYSLWSLYFDSILFYLFSIAFSCICSSSTFFFSAFRFFFSYFLSLFLSIERTHSKYILLVMVPGHHVSLAIAES